jgi:hypothetical protein
MLSPTHPTFLFPRPKIKLKGRHFETREVMEAESQAVLNTVTEHAGKGVEVASMPKFSF